MNGGRAAAVAGAVLLAGAVAWLAARPSEPIAPPDGNGRVPPVTGTTGRDGNPPVVGDAPRTFTSPEDCKSCHEEVYAEWWGSKHRQSFTDPFVRMLTEDFRDVTCLSCHVPQPIHMTKLGDQVFERSGRFETGVDCLSCHLREDGSVAATRDIPGAPCRPTRVDTLPTHLSCAGCHNQHWLVDDWMNLYAKPDPAKGAVRTEPRPETCNACHMPPAPRKGPDGAPREGKSHVFPGGHDPKMHEAAITFAARIEEGRLVAETANEGVGHRAPGDSRHKSYNVWITVTSDAGARIADRVEIAEYRMYYRMPPRESTNLRPGEKARATYDLPKGVKGTVRVELVFGKNPVDKNKRIAMPVHEVTLPFDTR